MTERNGVKEETVGGKEKKDGSVLDVAYKQYFRHTGTCNIPFKATTGQ